MIISFFFPLKKKNMAPLKDDKLWLILSHPINIFISANYEIIKILKPL